MSCAIDETNRRREIQSRYNEEHGIKPESVKAAIKEALSVSRKADASADAPMDEEEKQVAIGRLNEMMLEAASQLDFEKAARLRDRMLELQGAAPMATNEKSRRARRKRRS